MRDQHLQRSSSKDSIDVHRNVACLSGSTGEEIGWRDPHVKPSEDGFVDSPVQSGTPSKASVEQLRSDTSGSEDGMVLRGRRVRRRREDEALLRKETPRRKKLGRPLVYEGDPDADPTLTEDERRRIRRRIANRESARRVRDKRLLQMGYMHDEMDVLREDYAELTARVEQVSAHRAVLKSQLADVQLTLEETEARNKALQQECLSLRRSVEFLDRGGLQGLADRQRSCNDLPGCNTCITTADWPGQPDSTCQTAEPRGPYNVQQAILDAFPSFALDDVPMNIESLGLPPAMFPGPPHSRADRV